MRRAIVKSGFTLVEMLVVITIIGILTALLIPVVKGARARARLQVARAQISEIEKALETFRDSFGRYPPDRVTYVPQRDAGGTLTGPAAWEVIIEPPVAGNGWCDTEADSNDLQWTPPNTTVGPGQILVDVTSAGATAWERNTILPSLPGGGLVPARTEDDVLRDWTIFLDANGDPVDLNGSGQGNDPDGDGMALDDAECLYYFLCVPFKANPGADYTYANFQNAAYSYLTDPSTFEFRPGNYLCAVSPVNAGSFYAPRPEEVGDTDGDGYLELLDLYGNPLRCVRAAAWVIVETVAGTANSTAGGDDRQFVEPGQSTQAGDIVVHPGPNWWGDSAVGASEQAFRRKWPGGSPALIYSTGPNGEDNIGISDAAHGQKNVDDDHDGITDNEDDISNVSWIAGQE